MASFRPVIFSVIPAGQTLMGAVTLHQDTWDNHITVNHPEMIGLDDKVELVVSTPSAIYASTSMAGSFLFVNTGIVDVTNRFLRVAVGADRSVKSAYFSSATGGSPLWP
jgi:hypothetical protein